VGHTPGPWRVVGRFYIEAATDPVCEVCRPTRRTREALEVIDADARLIAAAPDMFAALEQLEGLCMMETRQRPLAIIRAALAKVRGEA
jgi:hypothetical protein